MPSFGTFVVTRGMVFIWMLPLDQENEQNKLFKNKTRGGIKNQLISLCLFVFIITINSGLMYQVINPAVRIQLKHTLEVFFRNTMFQAVRGSSAPC